MNNYYITDLKINELDRENIFLKDKYTVEMIFSNGKRLKSFKTNFNESLINDLEGVKNEEDLERLQI